MNDEEIADQGERVVGTIRDYNFYSHLSMYEFALPLLQGKKVLDCGCGTGYGSAHLASGGVTSVNAVDYSAKAIEFAEAHYGDSGVKFAVADLNAPFPFQDSSFDAVFSSQAMEHIAQIESFFSECCRVLKPGGTLISAVPAIVRQTGSRSLEENIWNIYHVTNLTPLGWHSKTHRYFDDVTPYYHWVSPKHDCTWEEFWHELGKSAAETTIRETDFVYGETTVEDINTRDKNLNTVLVSRNPRPAPLPHMVEEFLPPEWTEGAISAAVRLSYGNALIKKTRMETETAARFQIEELNEQINELKQQIIDLKASTSWKITEPLRALRRLI